MNIQTCKTVLDNAYYTQKVALSLTITQD